jgi:hypothetical protein
VQIELLKLRRAFAVVRELRATHEARQAALADFKRKVRDQGRNERRGYAQTAGGVESVAAARLLVGRALG